MPSCACPNLLADCVGVDSPITGMSSLTRDQCYFYASCSARADAYAPAPIAGGFVTQQCAYTVLAAGTQAEADALASSACGGLPSAEGTGGGGGGGGADGGGGGGGGDGGGGDGTAGGNSLATLEPFLCLNVTPDTPPTYIVTGSNSTDDWTFTSTSLPGGMSLSKSANNAVQLVGAPTQTGTFTFTLTASLTLNPNLHMHINDTLQVMGITNNPMLPDTGSDTGLAIALDTAFPLEAYDLQLNVEGATGTVTFALAHPELLPAWLLFSSAGEFTGTPQDVDAGIKYYVEVNMIDSLDHACSATVTIRVSCRFTNGQPPDGIICTPYDFQFTAVPPGLTFYGVLPEGLEMDDSGHVTGSPTQDHNGTADFEITAYDPDVTEYDQYGNLIHPIACTGKWTINITGSDGVAKAVESMGDWVLVYSQDPLQGTIHTTGSPKNGDFEITVSGTIYGTFRRIWAKGLVRCPDQVDYHITGKIEGSALGVEMPPGTEDVPQTDGPNHSISFHTAGHQVYADQQNWNPFSAEVTFVNPIVVPLTDLTNDNSWLDIQVNCGHFLPFGDDWTLWPYNFVVKGSMRPLTPP